MSITDIIKLLVLLNIYYNSHYNGIVLA